MAYKAVTRRRCFAITFDVLDSSRSTCDVLLIGSQVETAAWRLTGMPRGVRRTLSAPLSPSPGPWRTSCRGEVGVVKLACSHKGAAGQHSERERFYSTESRRPNQREPSRLPIFDRTVNYKRGEPCLAGEKTLTTRNPSTQKPANELGHGGCRYIPFSPIFFSSLGCCRRSSSCAAFLTC